MKKKEWSSRPENKAKRKLRQQTSEYKAKKSEYDSRLRQTSEYKIKRKQMTSTSEYKAKKREVANRPENKLKTKKYNERSDVKARKKITRDKPENKAKKKEVSDRPENKMKIQLINADRRLNILQTYSKRLSTSDIPCCRCCRLNSNIDFLAIDHIAGRRKMNSEPELIKLGYSSKLKGNALQRWIIENNFPDGFQILCQNCNFSKGMKKNNNKCPMENKPH